MIKNNFSYNIEGDKLARDLFHNSDGEISFKFNRISLKKLKAGFF